MRKLSKGELVLKESFQALGLNERESELAAIGRDDEPRNTENGNLEKQLVEAFKVLGLSESGAKIAAQGRQPWPTTAMQSLRENAVTDSPANGERAGDGRQLIELQESGVICGYTS